jgi:hypothetical protein
MKLITSVNISTNYMNTINLIELIIFINLIYDIHA